jgi:predicted NACHT family NTPase
MLLDRQGLPNTRPSRLCLGCNYFSLPRTTPTPTPTLVQLWRRRQKLLPERQGLPVWAAKEQLVREVAANRTLIVVGETGSGKTTQVCVGGGDNK